MMRNMSPRLRSTALAQFARKNDVPSGSSKPLFVDVSTILPTNNSAESYIHWRRRLQVTIYFAMLLSFIHTLHTYCFARVYYSYVLNPDLSRNLLRLPRDTFFVKSLPDKATQPYFNFNSANIIPPLQPMWSCRNSETDSSQVIPKLVFLQFGETASRTISAILNGYAQFCHNGIAIVEHCQHVSLEYLTSASIIQNQLDPDHYWQNSPTSPFAHQPCRLVHASDRNGQILTTMHQPSQEPLPVVRTNLLHDYDIDILTGEVPLGINAYWYMDDHASNDTSRPVPVRYAAIFREPLSKFVSEYYNANSKLRDKPSNQIIDELYQRSVTELQRGQYYGTSSSKTKISTTAMYQLITPAQKWWIARNKVKLTMDRRVNLTKSNLVKYSVAVGIFENFDNAVNMLQTLLDKERRLTKFFDLFKKNKQPLQDEMKQDDNMNVMIQKVRDEIRSNETIWQPIKSYLQYEDEVYQFAVWLHSQQQQTT